MKRVAKCNTNANYTFLQNVTVSMSGHTNTAVSKAYFYLWFLFQPSATRFLDKEYAQRNVTQANPLCCIIIKIVIQIWRMIDKWYWFLFSELEPDY